MAGDASGNVWIADGTNTVTELRPNSSVIHTYTVGVNLVYILVDAKGSVWVSNLADNTVDVISPSGRSMATYGVAMTPTEIAIDSKNDTWIVNEGDSTVTEFVGLTRGPQ